MEDWMQYAKDLAKAERELKIEHWVYITFEIRHKEGHREVLHKIDLPRYMVKRWQWLIEWRRAKLVCKYPRKNICVYTSEFNIIKKFANTCSRYILTLSYSVSIKESIYQKM